MDKPIDKNELKTQVQTLVDEIFSAKEQAEIRKNTEKALDESARVVNDLKTALEKKNTEVSELTEKSGKYAAQIEDTQSKLEAAETALTEKAEELAKKEDEFQKKCDELATVQTVIDGMKKDQAADVRMKELEKASVAHTDRETQKIKIREMDDAAFAAYKEELVSIRQAVIDELKTKNAESAAAGKNTAAAMNMETASAGADIRQKYAELGKAMAERFKSEGK